ncbi:MAG: aminotransferase class V-fold PLP-dependent enzyme [Nitrospirae bacterium]|nr:aminotransferase class V-fold PLP-dependent enzyme [Nitrospirota bacterium]
MKKHQIYLDNAATTPMDPKVLEAMLPYFTEKYGNPEALHTKGKESLIAIDNARETVAKILNCRAREIIFCGTATEANNLAIFGTARANKDKGTHLITTKIEHSSVRRPFEQLEKEGFDVTYLDVDNEGFVNPDDIKKALTPKTTLVSVMYANNEIGTIEPIKKIGKILHDHQAYFHTDACQIPGAETLDTKTLKIDMMTLNGSKIYGPKGIGVLYVNKETKIEPIIFGSAHEYSLRAGTHNTPLIVGFAKALELITKSDNKKITKLRDKLLTALLKKIPRAHLNGPTNHRLPNNINITIPGIHAQEILLHLDEAGIYVSTGAACNMGNEKPSKTLEAIGLPQKEILSSLRITLGKNTTEEDIDYVIKTFPTP